MDFLRATTRKLDREHSATLALLERFGRGLLDIAPGRATDERFAPLARSVAFAIGDEIDRHFRYEEEALFPVLVAAGEGAHADLLLEEHAAIRACAGALLPLLQAAASGPLDAQRAMALKPLALEFVERLSAHIHMETGGLLPLLDDLVDEATDQHLAFADATD
jgi:hemerythrin-like domain-containing protein